MHMFLIYVRRVIIKIFFWFQVHDLFDFCAVKIMTKGKFSN